jgi:NAD(P)-dependent dehydrogenase (short-subunit alcohol dehydrogenase family)
MEKVWFITGAGRGMGVGFAKAALAAGNAVVATGRNTDAVTKAVGQADDLLVVKLDITSLANAKQKVADLQQQIDAYRDVSISLAWEEA